jgi:Lon protease-like protein
VRSVLPTRERAASIRAVSLESNTTLAPRPAKTLASASPMPIEAPVIATTVPDCSMFLLLMRARYGVKAWRTIYEFRASLGVDTKVKGLLPLFPLDVVLFPGTPLPLHIFEPRYKELVSECLEQKQTFGIVRAEQEGLADVGCTAEIVAVTKNYPDGSMDIVTEGRERFEVLEVDEQKSFLRGDVIYFQDELDSPSADQVAHAIELHREILTMGGAQQTLPAVQDKVSFYLAGSLPLDLDFKQALLEMRSESQRIDAVVTAFEAILPKLRRAVQSRQKAGGNGHAHS